MDKIEKKCRLKLAAIRVRLILSLALRQFETSLLLALILAALVVLAGRLFFPYWNAPHYVIGILFGVPVAALATTCLKWFTTDAAARYADHELLLKERVYSALEIARENPQSRFAMPLLKDAHGHIEKVNPAESFPVRPGRRAMHSAIVAAVLIGVLFMPQFDLLTRADAADTKALIMREGKNLAGLKKRVDPLLSEKENAEAKELLKKVEDLAKKMEKAKVDQKTALKELSKLQEDARKLEQSDQQSGSDEMRKLAEMLSKSLSGDPAPSGRSATDAEYDQLMRDLQKLMAQAEQGQMTAEQAAELSRQLAEAAALAQKMDGMGDLAEALKQAAQQAGQTSSSAMMQNSSDAQAQAMARQMLQQLQQMQQAAQQSGQPMSKEMQQAIKQLQSACQSGNCQSMRQAMSQCMSQAGKQGSGMNQQQLSQMLKQMAKNGANCKMSSSQCQSMNSAMNKLGSSMSQLGKGLSGSQGLKMMAKGLGQCKSGLSKSGMQGQSMCVSKRGSGSNWGTGSTNELANPFQGKAGMITEDRQKDGVTPSRQGQAAPGQVDGPIARVGAANEFQLSGTPSSDGEIEQQVISGVAELGEHGYLPSFELSPADLQELESAMERQNIPITYRELVKKYFESLNRQE